MRFCQQSPARIVRLLVPVIGLLTGCATDRQLLPAEERLIARIAARAAANPALADRASFRRAVAAQGALHRRDFVPPAVRAYADVDVPLPLGEGQTISDPYIVAVMTAAAGVTRGSRVLEVGTGSGYQAAVLARLGGTVATIEIVPELARSAAERLRRLHISRVTVRTGDGFAGWPERAPFDAIIVTAGVAAVPPPLLAQLAPNGRIVVPIGTSPSNQRLEVVTLRPDGGTIACMLGPAAFVPFTGAAAGALAPATAPADLPYCYGRPVT